MKPSKIFHQQIWLITTLLQHPYITLKELNERWVEDEVADGNALSRSSFYRHRDEIYDMFGVVIESDKSYRHYIANPQNLKSQSIESRLLSTLTVNCALSDSAVIRDQILLERIPAGEQFLPTIIKAIMMKRRIILRHQKFGFEPTERLVEPYTLKLFKQRWYLLVRTEEQFKKFALDRMLSIEVTNERFKMIKGFSAEAYFAEYFGVLTDDTPLAHIVIRANRLMANYLRTLPLHATQRELESTDEYTDFALDLRPTRDFIGELLSMDEGIEVLQPEELRHQIRDKLSRMLNKY